MVLAILVVIIDGWFYYHKTASKLAWFQDVQSILNHHSAGLLALSRSKANCAKAFNSANSSNFQKNS